MAVFPDGSLAVTVKLLAVPAVIGEAYPATISVLAAPGITVIPDCVPVIVAVTVSVAVIVWLPAVFSVAEKVPVPLVSVEFAGSVAEPSLLVKCTVPA